MSSRTPDQKQARALQKRTGWKYAECLALVQTLSPEALEVRIRMLSTPEAPRDERGHAIEIETRRRRIVGLPPEGEP